MKPEQLARLFHETYERLSPDFGYKTREDSAKPWDEVPAQNKALMIAVCAAISVSDAIYMPHVWFCPSCACELVKRTGNNQTIPNPVYSDKCPNDGTTLERMTWKRKAEQLLQTVPDANCMAIINELRKEEGSSVEIFCDNSHRTVAAGADDGRCAVEVTGEWTSWSAKRFEADSIIGALQAAEIAKGNFDLAKQKNTRSKFRWNYERREGVLWVCEGQHDKLEPCVWRKATPEETEEVSTYVGPGNAYAHDDKESLQMRAQSRGNAEMSTDEQ